MCGALSRLSAGICSNCKNVFTATSSTLLTDVLETVPPAAVAENFDYINAEKVMTKLNSVMSSMPNALPELVTQVPPVFNDVSGMTSSTRAAELIAASSVAAVLPTSAVMAIESARRVLESGRTEELNSVAIEENNLAPDPVEPEVLANNAASDQVSRSHFPAGDFFDEVRVPRSSFSQDSAASAPEHVASDELSTVYESANNSSRFVEDCRNAIERSLQEQSIVTPEIFSQNSKSSKRMTKHKPSSKPRSQAALRQTSLEDSVSQSKNDAAELDHYVLKLPKKFAVFAGLIICLVAFFVVKGIGNQPLADKPVAPPLTELVDAKIPSKDFNKRVVLTQTNFLGEYRMRLTEHNGALSEGVLLLNSRNGNSFSGEAVINHLQARQLLNNSNGTIRVNNVISRQSYSINGTCANSNVLSMRLIPKNTTFRPMRIDAVAEYSGNKLLISGTWYAELARAWARPSARFQFQAIQSKTIESSGSGDWIKAIFWNDADSMHTRFLKILAVFLMAGVAIAWSSIKFFGMDGLLSRWEREKYIPNSKRKEHQKLLNQLAPRNAKHTGALFLGDRADWKVSDPLSPRSLYMPAKMRATNPHMLVIGAGTKGKSRLLASQITDDIRHADRAVIVIDSDGSLVDLLLSWAASQPDGKQLAKRIQVIDPCKRESFLGYNPLIVGDLETVSSHAASIVMGFKAVYTEAQNSQNQWNPQTANILRNALILLILNKRLLSDLPLLLSDNDFRDLMLQQVEREHPQESKTLLEAWYNYKKLARSEQWINWIEPILNRVQPLLSEPRLSRLLTEREHAVDLDEVLTNNGVLLVRVPEGQLHKGGNLLGSLVVTGVRQAAIEQYENEGSESNPCSIFVDELNNFFDAELFDAITSETRKLQIGIIGTLKTMQDLPEEFRNRASLSVGAMALFSVGKKDADFLGPTMFRVDGRRVKKWNIRDWFNPPNATPTTDLVSDEEKFNIDRLLGQSERSYFCYLVGSQAGVFQMKSREFQDISKDKINWDLLDKMYELKQLSDDEAFEADE